MSLSRTETKSPSISDSQLILAKWIAPMNAPILRGGAVAIRDGTIQSFGPQKFLRNQFPDAAILDLGNSILLPGLVNPHVHLELSHLECGDSPASFSAWLISLIGRLNPTRGDESVIRAAVRRGVEQCLRFGVTSVGDISRECRTTRAELSAGPLRVVSYGEVQAMGQRRVLLDERFAPAAETSQESQSLRVGISPHAPYSIEPFGYAKCLEFARQNARPIATHLAENPQEAEFLADHSGPFRDLWDDVIQAWDNQVPRFAGGPIRFAKSLGLLDYPTLLAHVNYCDDEEMRLLSEGQASVVYCPRTHRYFGHSPHRWREMLDRGINVAIGTDSCASSPDLNIVDDLRLVHQLSPAFPVEQLWQMVTTRAARAVRHPTGIGAISPGNAADFVAFAVHTDQPLVEILETEILPTHLWIGGNLINLLLTPNPTAAND